MSAAADDHIKISRRRCLELGAWGAAAAPLALLPARAKASPVGAVRKRAVRLAHLTDVHVQPERGADAGLAQCLQHVQSQQDPVELIVTGGDGVMDSADVDPARSQMLVDMWRKVLKQDCSLPVRHTIGNHDLRPWSKPGTDERSARAWAMDMYGLDARYYAFDHAGWRFVVLDSVRPEGDGYTSGLDAEQRAWLESELKQLNPATPVVIFSHVPILSITAITFDKKHYSDGEHRVPGGWMFADAVPVHYLLREHPNVKLCLSGHLHLVDRCEVDGVTYVCGGAVSANWWEGNLQKVDEGYGLVDLYDDGSFSYAYEPYGWKVRPE